MTIGAMSEGSRPVTRKRFVVCRCFQKKQNIERNRKKKTIVNLTIEYGSDETCELVVRRKSWLPPHDNLAISAAKGLRSIINLTRKARAQAPTRHIPHNIRPLPGSPPP